MWLVIGALVGWLAGKIMKTSYSLLGNIVVGIIGSVLGGWVFSSLGLSFESELGSFVTAVVGAMILIWALKFIKKK